jgi:hypothetical protein
VTIGQTFFAFSDHPVFVSIVSSLSGVDGNRLRALPPGQFAICCGTQCQKTRHRVIYQQIQILRISLDPNGITIDLGSGGIRKPEWSQQSMYFDTGSGPTPQIFTETRQELEG